MSASPEWQQFAVQQKRQGTGCIPTAYEILLRAAGVTGVDFTSFQDDFDLDKEGGQARNHFYTVAAEIQKKYPFIEFKCETFAKGDGDKKLARVEEFLTRMRPVIVSLANAPYGGVGWHIMVVLDATNHDLVLLEYVDQSGNPKTKTVSKQDFVTIHDKFLGGDEIAYLATSDQNAEHL